MVGQADLVRRTAFRTPRGQEPPMPRITVGTEDDAPIEIHYRRVLLAA